MAIFNFQKLTKYPILFSGSTGNLHTNQQLGIFRKFNLYSNVIDIVSMPSTTPNNVYQYRRISVPFFKAIVENHGSNAISKLWEETWSHIRNDSIAFQQRIEKISNVSSGVRFEYRVEYKNLTSSLNIIDTIISTDTIRNLTFVIDNETLKKWIFYLQSLISRPLIKSFFDLHRNFNLNDLKNATMSLLNINAFESLLVWSMWSGRTDTSAKFLLWGRAFNLKDSIFLQNQPVFTSSRLSEDNLKFCIDDSEDELYKECIDLLCDKKFKFDEPFSVIFTTCSIVKSSINLEEIAGVIWKAYINQFEREVFIPEAWYDKQLIMEKLNLEIVLIRKRKVALRDEIEKIFNVKNLMKKCWQKAYLFAFKTATSKFENKKIKDQLFTAARSMGIELVHASGGEERFFSSRNNSFVEIYYELAPPPNVMNFHEFDNVTPISPIIQLPLQIRPASPINNIIRSGNQQNRPANSRNFWTFEEEQNLVLGLNRHGEGNWAKILNDPSLIFFNERKRTNINLKDKMRNLKNSRKLSLINGLYSLENSNNRPISSIQSSLPNEVRQEERLVPVQRAVDIEQERLGQLINFLNNNVSSTNVIDSISDVLPEPLYEEMGQGIETVFEEIIQQSSEGNLINDSTEPGQNADSQQIVSQVQEVFENILPNEFTRTINGENRTSQQILYDICRNLELNNEKFISILTFFQTSRDSFTWSTFTRKFWSSKNRPSKENMLLFKNELIREGIVSLSGKALVSNIVNNTNID
jgi:hypothetical protein